MAKDPPKRVSRRSPADRWREVEDFTGPSLSGLGLAPVPFVPALLEVAHERAPGLALLASAGCPGLADRRTAHRGEIDAGAHHNKAEDPDKDVLHRHPDQQQQHARESREHADDKVAGGP